MVRFEFNDAGFDYSKPHICHGGKGGGGGGTNTVTQTANPPAEVMQAYQTALNSAQTASSQPLQQYGGPFIAGFTPDQTSAFNNISGLQGVADPYINQAAGLIGQSTQPLWSGVQQFSPEAVQQYQNPYTQQVVQSTLANIQQNNALQQNQLKGNAISQGAWGGDRAGLASAELSRNQDLATNQTLAQLNSQGYQQGLQEFNTQQQSQLGANQANAYLAQQGAFGLGNLGQEALSTGLGQAAAQLQTGTQQQQQGQNILNVPYQQFMQQQAYPFQTAQYFANIAEGLGGGMGGSSATTSPGPSTLSQVAGAGASGLGLLGMSGAFSGVNAASGAATAGWLGDALGLASWIPWKKGGRVEMDDGGAVGGVSPSAISSEGLNPQAQQQYQRFASMDPNQLQQLLFRMPQGSPYTTMVQKALNEKRMMPNVGTPAQGGLQPQGYDDGGDVPDDFGGIASPPPNAVDLPVRDKGYIPEKVSPWEGLAVAGLGSMAGTSPFAGVNIGKGGLEGMKYLSEQRQQAAKETYQSGELGVRKQEARARAQQLTAMLEHYKAEEKNWAAERENQAAGIDLKRKEFERGKFMPYTDVTGNKGVFNTATGNWETAGGAGALPPSPTGNTVTKDIMDISKNQLESRNKNYSPANTAQADEVAKNLLSTLNKYDLGPASGETSELNRWSSAIGLDASKVFPSVMSPDDYKNVMANIGTLKAAAMNGAKNVRNLREFQAITSPAELFGGGNMSVQSQIAILNSAAHSAEAEHNFYNAYYNKYHTLDGADTVWNEYNKNNDLVKRDKNGDPTESNPAYFSPQNIMQYVDGAPAIYQQAIGGKKDVPAQDLPPVQPGGDSLNITPNPNGPPMVSPSAPSAPPPWANGMDLQFSPSLGIYRDKKSGQKYDKDGLQLP